MLGESVYSVRRYSEQQEGGNDDGDIYLDFCVRSTLQGRIVELFRCVE
jgi:hypothetical protein